MSPRSSLLLWIARIWALTIIGLNLAAPLLAERWAWGVWPATFTPAAWRIALAAAAVILILSGDRVWRRFGAPVAARLSTIDPGSRAVRLAIALAAAVPFYLLRIRHLEWGDAELIVRALADPYRITYVWQAPLDIFIHARLWQWTNVAFGWGDPTPVYNILSVAAGVVFVYVLLGIACTMGRNRTERFLIVGLVATLGTMQLFFGYIENYPIMTAGVLLYTWLGLRTLRGELHIVWPASVLALTHAFHPSTLILTPSLLYLLLRQRNSREGKNVLTKDDPAVGRSAGTAKPAGRAPFARSVLAVVAPYALVLLGVVVLMEGGGHGLNALATVDFPGGGDRQWFVPLFEVTTEWQHYTMFSLGHLVDIVNQQLLVAPVVWPMLLVVAIVAWRRLPLRDETFRFLLLMAAFYLLLTLTWNADYGGQKDWDLFSPAAVPAALLLAYVLPRAIPEGRALRGAGWALIAAQCYHTLLWVLRNTQP